MKSRKSLNIQCKDCLVGHLCLAKDLSAEEINILDVNIQYVKVLQPGEYLYAQGNQLTKIYAIYSGLCKDYSVNEDGDAVINEFYFPGDILGLEYMHKEVFQFNAVAVKETVVCVVPLELLKDSGEKFWLKNRLLEILCQQIENSRNYSNKTNVKRRIAAFLLNLIHRSLERPTQQKMQNEVDLNSLIDGPISIPMSYIDISNKIGISNETFSRSLKEFIDEHYFELNNNAMFNIDIDGLKSLL